MSTNYNIINGGTTFNLDVNGIISNNNSQIRLLCKTADGAIVINLPPISDFGVSINASIFVDDVDNMASTNNITINSNVGNTIENASFYTINNNGGKIVIYISSFIEFGVLGLNISSGLTYMGAWNALTNNPTLTSSVGIGGQYYIVSVAGTTNLNGITDWQVGDWAIFESASNEWQKIDNHDVNAYSFIQEEGTPLLQQNTIDFQGAGVVASNGIGKTIITIAGSPLTTNYGLFTQTANSTPVTATISETSIIGGGVGTLTVPANGFQVGDSFVAKLYGHITCVGTATIQIRIKSGSVLLADTGIIALDVTTSKHWNMEINFTIRSLGIASVGSIVSAGLFNYIKNSGLNFEGANFVFLNNTTFDTTILNTLNITAQWNTNNAGNSIYSDIFVLNKIY